MQNAIDQEKTEQQERLDRAATMIKVPLIQLDRLIKERQLNSMVKNGERVEYLNKMIRQLLVL